VLGGSAHDDAGDAAVAGVEDATAGSPNESIRSTSSAAVFGASSLGFATTALPAAMAATIGTSSSCTG
jgi:hypothetical protein